MLTNMRYLPKINLKYETIVVISNLILRNGT